MTGIRPGPGSAPPDVAAPLASAQRICIVMLTAIGDAVHVLPVVSAIKRHRPSIHISWVLQPAAATLADGHPSVDQILVFQRDRGWRAFVEMRRTLRERRFDAVLLLQPYLKAAVLASFARAGVKLGTDRRRARDLSWLVTNRRLPARPMSHMQDQFLEFLEPFGASAEPLVWDLGPWSAERRWQREFFARFERPVVSVVVGTSKPDKDWLPERWAAVIDALDHDFDLQPILVGGRSARELAAERVIMSRAHSRPVSALGSGVRPLVSILDGSVLVLSPDTGPLHMAVALDRPVISLIGYTDPRRTGPYRRFHDLVIDAFHDPGETGAVTAERRYGRMGRIAVADVLAKVERWKAEYAR
jgi:heptosyltransferase I